MIIILANMLELDNDYNCIHSDNATNEANTVINTISIRLSFIKTSRQKHCQFKIQLIKVDMALKQ